MFPNPKLYSLEAASAIRKQGPKGAFVLTNGCFDMLHVGHIYALQQAAQWGSLWVALNSDASVRSLKGPTRPIFTEQERAYMLAALSCVSGIIIFDTPRLDHEIRELHPDIYAKSSDYTLETLAPEERAALKNVHAGIRFTSILPGFSTTRLIEKIAATHSA
ncbi:MAG: adenylyltransferase/cytidyltransferase family protein [Verrucomicrobiota bacterium]|nr:MAG: adenylyltransferase/cytidyltransferase family protein [Verrucomicrobiota bacterium]